MNKIFMATMGGFIAWGFGCYIGDIIYGISLLPATIIVVAALISLSVFTKNIFMAIKVYEDLHERD